MSSIAEVSNIVEEYLEAVLRLQEKSGSARTNELVKMMKVAPGTVTNTIERLEKELLLTHEPYKGVRLTQKGRSIALSVLRKHRLCERLLTDILDVEWHKAHDYACKLEHGVSDDLAAKIEKALKSPETCPHGNPIDTESRRHLSSKSKPLAESNVGQKVLVTKIVDEQSDVLQYLGTLGLRPGIALEVVEKVPFDGPITVKIHERAHALSRQMASLIHVREVEPPRKYARTS
jgi:DtxR family Mn-dependent transcriptional regulator